MELLQKFRQNEHHSSQLTAHSSQLTLKLRRKFQKIKRQTLSVLLIISLLISQLTSLFVPLVYAASSPWTQTDWSGGVGASTTNQYSAASSTDATTTSGQVTLTNTEKFTGYGVDTTSNLASWTGLNPSNVSGLTLHYKADAITGVSDGGTVTTWDDSSGNNNYATQATSSNRPTYLTNQLNGYPILRFDGANDVLGIVSTTTLSSMSVFVVENLISGTTPTCTNTYYPFLMGGETDSTGLYWGLETRGSGGCSAGTADSIDIFAGFGNDARATLTNMAAFGSWKMISAVTQSSGIHNTTVNANLSSATMSTTGTNQTLNVQLGNSTGTAIGGIGGAGGTQAGDLQANVDIAEILVYNSAISSANRHAIENYLAMKYSLGHTITLDTTTKRTGAGSTKVVASSATTAEFSQSVNVGDTNTYNLVAYAYTDGSAITSSDAELYYNGSTVSTTYTAAGSGWYKLSGTVTGANASRDYGVQVKAGKTVYLDDFSLNSYASSGTLTSSIFDSEFTGGAAWGTLTYTATSPTNTTVSVKMRTSNSSSMTGATAFGSCSAITSGSDISSNSCVTDSHRYIQYLLTLSNSSTEVTPTFSDISIAFATYDADAPSISLTALTPDPNSDNTPTLSGTATDTIGTVSNVQFQMDSTSGSWSSCTASDGSFNSASEAFSCTAATLTDGSHTMYVRATDSNGNTTSSNYASDTFTIDATTPVSIDLDSPGDNSYTNSERPSFKWKATTDATAGLSKYVLEIDNPSIGSSQPSGDFTIDNIPTSGTTDITSNNKYVIHFENFNDSDSTNNYISVYTKSTNDWGTSENDGKLREGRVSWKVKAVDNAANETSSSRTLFVDRTNPNVEFTQINSTPFTSSNFSTTDKTPTIFGKITDPLAGADNNGQTKQDENGPKVASGPKEVNIKVEKKNGLTYSLVTLYKINMDNPYYTCEEGKTIDNSKQKCDKYLPFEYTPKENLDLGTYKITLSGKDKADNSSSETTLTLNITTLAKITSTEEKKTIEEETNTLKPEEKEQIKQELEITKPTEEVPVSTLEKTGQNITQAGKNFFDGLGTVAHNIITGVGNGIAFTFNSIGNGIAFTFNSIGNGLAFVFDKAGQRYNAIAYHSPGVIKTILVGIQSGTTNLANAIGGGVHNTKEGIANLAFGIGERTQDVSDTLGFAFVKFGYLFVNEPTKIQDVQVLVLSPTSVKVSWITNHPANGKVNYGLDRTYPLEQQTEKRTTHHEFTLNNLQPNTTYLFEVMSQNKNYVYDANREFRTPAK